MAEETPAPTNRPDGFNPRFVFYASCISLIATAMAFAIRGDITNDLKNHFMLNDFQTGWIVGAWAWGFAGAILFGGPLVDLLGMGRIMLLAFLGHAAGCVLTIIAPGFGILFAATLIVGIGNGLVEAAINPLVATMYPDEKTAKLNLLHAWFPGGIVIGGLICFGISSLHLPDLQLGSYVLKVWQVKQAVLLVPTIIYGIMFAGQKLPVTERVAAGVSWGEMFREALRPLYLIMLVSMMCTASTELVPNGWIANIMQRSIEGMAAAGILVLVFINLVMCIGRFFAGPLAHALSPTGIILSGAVVSIIGLLVMSAAQGAAVAFGGAFIFAVGVCFFWPTMLGITSERFPKGGALLLAMTGAAGNVSVALLNPVFGRISDLKGEDPQAALPYVIVLPIITIVIFGAIFLMDRAKGGYKAVKIGPDKGETPSAPMTGDS
ncbi:MAG: MFS transporter [Candidatus Zipacnadales bacterium]